MILELIISPVANIRRHARHVKYGNSSSGTDRAPGVRALFHLLQISAFLDRCFHGHVHKKYVHIYIHGCIYQFSVRALGRFLFVRLSQSKRTGSCRLGDMIILPRRRNCKFQVCDHRKKN